MADTSVQAIDKAVDSVLFPGLVMCVQTITMSIDLISPVNSCVFSCEHACSLFD